jgi:hypothetical protein
MDELLTDSEGNPLLTQNSEEGFIDCLFRITELTSTPSHHTFRMLASHDGRVVGCRSIVMRGIQGGFDGGMKLIKEHVYRPAVQLLRSGPESDALVESLAALYGMERADRRMHELVRFTGIALHQGAVDMETEAIKIKLFCRDAPDDPPDDYSESFFNLSLPEGLVAWNEKDVEYRKPLIGALTLS